MAAVCVELSAEGRQPGSGAKTFFDTQRRAADLFPPPGAPFFRGRLTPARKRLPTKPLPPPRAGISSALPYRHGLAVDFIGKTAPLIFGVSPGVFSRENVHPPGGVRRRISVSGRFFIARFLRPPYFRPDTLYNISGKRSWLRRRFVPRWHSRSGGFPGGKWRVMPNGEGFFRWARQTIAKMLGVLQRFSAEKSVVWAVCHVSDMPKCQNSFQVLRCKTENQRRYGY